MTTPKPSLSDALAETLAALQLYFERAEALQRLFRLGEPTTEWFRVDVRHGAAGGTLKLSLAAEPSERLFALLAALRAGHGNLDALEVEARHLMLLSPADGEADDESGAASMTGGAP